MLKRVSLGLLGVFVLASLWSNLGPNPNYSTRNSLEIPIVPIGKNPCFDCSKEADDCNPCPCDPGGHIESKVISDGGENFRMYRIVECIPNIDSVSGKVQFSQKLELFYECSRNSLPFPDVIVSGQILQSKQPLLDSFKIEFRDFNDLTDPLLSKYTVEASKFLPPSEEPCNQCKTFLLVEYEFYMDSTKSYELVIGTQHKHNRLFSHLAAVKKNLLFPHLAVAAGRAIPVPFTAYIAPTLFEHPHRDTFKLELCNSQDSGSQN